jgi:hypothetical protein
MNANQFNEKWMEFKGELKQQWDKFTDEDLQQIEGSRQIYRQSPGTVWVWRGKESADEVGGCVASEVGAGSLWGKAALTRAHQEERDGSPSNFTLSVKEMKPWTTFTVGCIKGISEATAFTRVHIIVGEDIKTTHWLNITHGGRNHGDTSHNRRSD